MSEVYQRFGGGPEVGEMTLAFNWIDARNMTTKVIKILKLDGIAAEFVENKEILPYPPFITQTWYVPELRISTSTWEAQGYLVHGDIWGHFLTGLVVPAELHNFQPAILRLPRRLRLCGIGLHAAAEILALNPDADLDEYLNLRPD